MFCSCYLNKTWHVWVFKDKFCILNIKIFYNKNNFKFYHNEISNITKYEMLCPVFLCIVHDEN